MLNKCIMRYFFFPLASSAFEKKKKKKKNRLIAGYVTPGSVVYRTWGMDNNLGILNISEVQAKFDLLHSCQMKAVDTFFSIQESYNLGNRQTMDHLKFVQRLRSAKKPSLNGGRLLTTTSNFKIEFRKRVLNVRNVFMRTKYLVCRTRISLDGGRTLKSWVAFRALVIGHIR